MDLLHTPDFLARMLKKPADDSQSCNYLYRNMHENIGEAPEDTSDSLAHVNADISVVASPTDAEIVDFVCGKGEDEEMSDKEPREIQTTAEMRNIPRPLQNKAECSGGELYDA